LRFIELNIAILSYLWLKSHKRNVRDDTLTTSIFLFRQDLRLSDNIGLLEASRLGKVLPVYIYTKAEQSHIGSSSQLYLHYSLESLNRSLNNYLNIYQGDPLAIIARLVKQYKVTDVFWSRSYEPWKMAEDSAIKNKLTELQVDCHIINSSYLWEPKNIKNDTGSYYKIFTAYKRKASLFEPRKPVAAPTQLTLIHDEHNQTTLADLGLITHADWEKKIQQHWTFGELSALEKLEYFLTHHLKGYKKGRDYPAENQTSKLSVNLHFGEISPHQVWETAQRCRLFGASEEDIDHFLNELIWREFSCYLMTHFNQLPVENFQSKFDHFPWKKTKKLIDAWKTGQTGYPLIDAGMRELWETGYMHNRVRMVVASFLVKNLKIHWHIGRDWFWDCLVDADLANNSASWQWVAGCGVDAAPYFRIFNPTTQGEKFDDQGAYTKKFLPELKQLPDKYLFQPWMAPTHVLASSKIILGKTYPNPIVDLSTSRKEALEAYQKL